MRTGAVAGRSHELPEEACRPAVAVATGSGGIVAVEAAQGDPSARSPFVEFIGLAFAKMLSEHEDFS